MTFTGTENVAVIEDEAALVQAARSDPAALSRLYQRYVTPVYRYLYRWAGNAGEAEELTAQVFVDVVEGLANYREQGRFAAWLFTIARRKAIAALRHSHPVLAMGEVEGTVASDEDTLEQVVQGEQRRRLADLLAGLDESQRELLRLRFTCGLSYSAIGSILGRNEGAVKMAVHRLLRQLHAKWEEK